MNLRVFALLSLCASSCTAATLVVTNNADFGVGSLRQAITDANATPGPNTITFNIPGSGVQTISPFEQLPAITNAVTIDGTTQPGYAGTPVIVLSGNSLFGTASGLVIASGGCTVRALNIQLFKYNPRVCHGIVLAGNGGNLVVGCFIGTDATGTVQKFNNGEGIWISNSINNVIGGTNATDRNVLSGNLDGVCISDVGATGNQVLGNIIGLGVAGTNAVQNTHGILVSNAPNNIIGGVLPGARNVIAGQSSAEEVLITGPGATGNLVEGNYIGIRADGTALSTNNTFYDGVRLFNAPSNTIGGAVPGARNVISGNYTGVSMIGSNANGNIIMGNYIGTDFSGTVKIPNQQGIQANSLNSGPPPTNNTVGGTAPGSGNVISGNYSYGIYFNGSGTNLIQGNRIGTDATGMFPLGNGGSGSGAGILAASTGNVIGGSAPGAGNVISGNPNDGLDIFVASQNDLSSNNLVQGNLIGVAADGVSPLANGLVGIGGRGLSVLGANNNTIGGLVPNAANIVANNGLDGIYLAGSFGAYGIFGSNNVVLGNIVYSNGIVGASNGANPAGVTLLGPNVISQNSIYGNYRLGIGHAGAASETVNVFGQHHHFPTITNAASDGATTTIISSILTNDTPTTTFTLEFFSNPTADPSGFGQGRTYLGSTNILTDTNGNASFVATFPVGTPASNVVSATSTGFGTPTLESAVFARGQTVVAIPGCPTITPFYTLYTGRFGGTPQSPSQFSSSVGLFTVINIDTSGGSPGYSLDITGDLPPGVQFGGMPEYGKGGIDLVGTPEQAGTYHFTITAYDRANCPGSTDFTFIVNPTVTSVLFASSQANTPTAGSDLHPISTFTGELYDLLPPDLQLPGPMPLNFQRYYAALLKKDGLITGTLGDNWLHNFEMKLTATASNTVNIVNNRGRFIQFTNSGSTFTLVTPLDVPFQLATNAGSYFLGDPASQMIYTFDAAGKLASIADGHGNSQTLTYSGSQLTTVSDGLGRALNFLYNPGGFLTNVSDGTRSVRFVQTGNNLTSATDPLGFTTTYSYDTNNPAPGLMTAATKPQGNVPYSQVFNTNAQVISQTEAGTNTTLLSYSNLTTTLTDPLGNVRTDAHTASGQLESFTDQASNVIFLGSDDHQRRFAVADRLGNLTTMDYHVPSGKLSTLTNADGTVTSFNYAARTNSGLVFFDLSQIIYPDGTSEGFNYDGQGNLLVRTDRAGKTFGFSYNSRGQILTSTNPLGGVITYTYDTSGMLASRKDTDVGLTQFQYDPFKRLTNIINPDATTLRAAYDANDRPASVTDERGNTTQFTCDSNNRLIQVTDANLKTNQFAYDNRDRVIQTIDRLGKAASVVYDQRGHVASITDRNGNSTSFTYDPRLRPVAVTDAANKNWQLAYDAEGMLTSAANPLNQTNFIGRDQLGYPIASTNALNQSSALVRDSMRRVTQDIDEISRTNNYACDSRGLLTNATRPLIGAGSYQRNNLGLLSRLTGLNGEQWNFAYTPMGRLQSVTDPLNRTTTNGYDSRGRLQKTLFADGVSRTITYDPAGNLGQLQYSDSTLHIYGYDALNRLTIADNDTINYDAEGRITNTHSAGINFGAAYDAGGRLTNVSYDGGQFSVTYTYDSRNRLTRVKDSLTTAQMDFAYDDAGRLTNVIRANGVNGAYTYDAAGRLTRIQEGSIIDLQYAVDPAGQITNLNFVAPLDPANFTNASLNNFAYDAAHQINTPGYSYDARGRITNSPGHVFSWDGTSRLKAIDTVALTYNALDDLVMRRASTTTNRYFYNLAIPAKPIIAEANGTLVMQRYYVWSPAGRLLYMIDAANGNAVYYFHFDRVGSTLALTASNGTVSDAYAYTPYGVMLAHTGTSLQPFTYVGAFGVRTESAASLYQMRARYYDPASARFLSRDPLPPRLADGRSLDPYEYANENPALFIDPLGEEEFNSIGDGEFAKFFLIAFLGVGPGYFDQAKFEENDRYIKEHPEFVPYMPPVGSLEITQPQLPIPLPLPGAGQSSDRNEFIKSVFATTFVKQETPQIPSSICYDPTTRVGLNVNLATGTWEPNTSYVVTLPDALVIPAICEPTATCTSEGPCSCSDPGCTTETSRLCYPGDEPVGGPGPNLNINSGPMMLAPAPNADAEFHRALRTFGLSGAIF